MQDKKHAGSDAKVTSDYEDVIEKKPRTGLLKNLPLRDFTLVLPLLAVLLIVTLTVALIGMTVRDNETESRFKLTTDALWVEQYLRFQLQTFETEIRDFASDISVASDNADATDTRARHLIAIHPEFLRITRRDENGKILSAVPLNRLEQTAQDLQHNIPLQLTDRPVISPPRKTDDGWVADIIAPVIQAGQSAGSVAATFSLAKLLERNVPWWVAGKYQVSVTGIGGETLLSRSAVQTVDPEMQHTISFDPPLAGLYITVTPYKKNPAIGPLALSGAIIGLAVLVVINLWMAYRQSRRRAAAEHALRAEHAFRQAMENSLTIGMRARDRNSRIIYVNPEFCRMVGYTEQELLGLMPPHPYWAPEIIEVGIQRQLDLRSSEPASRQFETRFVRPDGTIIDVLVYEAPLIDADGTHIGWMGSIIDVTQRKKLEEERRQETARLQHNARLITMGEMASTLAHELNQPLAAITSYATGTLNMLEAQNTNNGEFATALEKLAEQAKRAGKIVHRVHDFVRKRTTSFRQHDLTALIYEAISFMGGETNKRGGKFTLNTPEEPVLVLVDGVLIQQVVINLLRNAQEATHQLPADRQIITITLDVRDGEARICVTDRGNGIAPDLQADIFTPFVSSKEDGMGMGLPICRSILEAHRGRLWLEASKAGTSGAIFILCIPLGNDESKWEQHVKAARETTV